MESIRLWITGVASAAVIGSVILALTPDGSAEKTVKTVVSTFLILSMLIPFSKGVELNTETQLSDENISVENKEEITDAIARQIKNKLNTSIEKILAQNGIQAYSVGIDMNTNGDEITIEKVTVVLSKESKKELSFVEKIIKAELDVDATVLLENSED